jgi:DNA-binding transcriptional regulator GbsR (MarR family)
MSASTMASWQRDFVERAAALEVAAGLPPSHVQVFAWLVVCEPPSQSVEQLRRALGLSSGAISMATNTLVGMGVVERVTHPGERRAHYRLHADGWERLLRRRLEAAGRLRAIAADALTHAPGPQARLSEMHDMYAWFEDRVGELLATDRPDRPARVRPA